MTLIIVDDKLWRCARDAVSRDPWAMTTMLIIMMTGKIRSFFRPHVCIYFVPLGGNNENSSCEIEMRFPFATQLILPRLLSSLLLL